MDLHYFFEKGGVYTSFLISRIEFHPYRIHGTLCVNNKIFYFISSTITRVYISCSSAAFFVFIRALELRNSNSHSQAPLGHSEVCAPFHETQLSLPSSGNADPQMPPPLTSKTMDAAMLFRQKKRDRYRSDGLTSQKLSSPWGARSSSFRVILIRNSKTATIFSRAHFILARCSSVQQETRSTLCTVSIAEKF